MDPTRGDQQSCGSGITAVRPAEWKKDHHPSPSVMQDELMLIETELQDGSKAQIVYRNGGQVLASDLEKLCVKVNDRNPRLAPAAPSPSTPPTWPGLAVWLPPHLTNTIGMSASPPAHLPTMHDLAVLHPSGGLARPAAAQGGGCAQEQLHGVLAGAASHAATTGRRAHRPGGRGQRAAHRCVRQLTHGQQACW